MKLVIVNELVSKEADNKRFISSKYGASNDLNDLRLKSVDFNEGLGKSFHFTITSVTYKWVLCNSIKLKSAAGIYACAVDHTGWLPRDNQRG